MTLFRIPTCLRLALGVAFFTTAAHAITDYDADGYDDVWEQRYDVTLAAFPLTGDFDGDGISNVDEMTAGTDPRSPGKALRVRELRLVGGQSEIRVNTEYGTRYQLVSSTSLDGPWTPEGAAITGTGAEYVFTASANSPSGRKFFRVRASDYDSDGDTVSDWAEGQLGTDPQSATSLTNASGGVANDGDTLRSLLSITASVVTADALAKEGTPARVRLTRSFGTMPLTVPFDLAGNPDPKKGSATPADYTLTGATGSATTFANGATTCDIVINGVIGTVPKVPRTLSFSFRPTGLPPVATAPTASVRIRDAAVTSANRRLYVAYLGREAGVNTTATGVATALVEGDNATAAISLTFSNLSSVQNTAYIRVGAGLEVFRISNGQVSGQTWPILAAQFMTTDQATLDALTAGSLYVSISSASFPGGEIRGNFQPASGSIVEPPPPPAPPTYGTVDFPNLAAAGVNNNPTLDRDIARFLMQATWGPTPESIQEVRDLISAAGNDAIAGYTAWIDRQMNLAQTPSPSLMKLVMAADIEEFLLRGNKPITFGNDPQFGGNSSQWNTGTRLWEASGIHNNNYPFESNRRREWWTLVLNSRDQLRQRMAMALHEIVVISENDATVDTYVYGAANYWDMLAANAFGPYRTILEQVTYSPMMGVYLSHLKNQRRITTGGTTISPDENYAREIMQLFSIGLVLRHPDGSLKLDGTTGLPIPTYDQGDITELARVMTGLSFGRFHPNASAPTFPSASNQAIGPSVVNTSFTTGNGHRYWQAPWTSPMRMFASTTAASNFHDFENYTSYNPTLTLPAGVTSASKILFREKVGQRVLPPRGTSQTAGTEAAANLDIADALDALAAHPNIRVFIPRLLIQRFTTSNPSAGYLYRVAQRYQETNGNLGEVLKAILLDHEARSLSIADGNASYGKPKEPIIHLAALLRALKFRSSAPLANLANVTTNFLATESPVNLPYEAAEFAKFPAGTTRFRWFDTEGSVAQSPQRAPSVFNWFLPDYVVPGPLGNAGLFAPELQVATESNVVRIANTHFNLLFTSTPPQTTNRPGFGVDNFFNLSGFQTAGGVQLSVPPIALPDTGANRTGTGYANQNGLNYFSAAQFTPGPVGDANGVPDAINNQLDNLLPGALDLTAANTLTRYYVDAYNASLAAQYPTGVPASPGTTQLNTAHDAAALAVLDQCDLLFTGGFLRARFGSLPSTTSSPRRFIIDALASGNVGSRTTHTTASNNGFLTNAQNRCRNIAYLVVTSPQALILK